MYDAVSGDFVYVSFQVEAWDQMMKIRIGFS